MHLFKYNLLIFFVFLPSLVSSQDVKTYIPPQAFNHIDNLNKEIDVYWPDHPMKYYFGGLIEHESCISLKHSRCWNPKSSLKTKREEGAGFGQITRAYTKEGKIRFDALAELKALHPKELSQWSWGNVYDRPDLQLRAIVLKTKDNYGVFRNIPDIIQRLKFTDVSYNQGVGKTKKDRTLCSLKKGCDPDKWDNNVEKSCSGTNNVIYGQRGPCDISRHHVKDIFDVRSNKYKPYIPKRSIEQKLSGNPIDLKIDYKTPEEQSLFDKLIDSLMFKK